MAKQPSSWTTTTALTWLLLVSGALAQAQALAGIDVSGPVETPSGLRTDRLTPRQLKIWKSIERLAVAADPSGTPLHPRLHDLWHRAGAIRQAVQVEMVERKDPAITRAGEVDVEATGSPREGRVIVLKLFPRVIDAAEVQEAVRRSDGFIPFEKLGKVERYAEVLAHELTHVLRILGDPAYARKNEELGREAAEFPTWGGRRTRGGAFSREVAERLRALHELRGRLEAPANAVEVEVWRELVAGQRAEVRRGAKLPLARVDD